MKNIILIILFLVGIFILNITFYYTSSDYQNFIKRVKKETSVNTQTWTIENFSWNNNNRENYFSWTIEPKEEKNISQNEVQAEKEEVKLWKSYQEILDLFKDYDLKKVDVSVNLFDLTNEYPDAYYEFYSPKLTVYFFTSKNYSDLYDIFKVLELELPFKLNASNSFWERSFFINFNSDVNDSFVRLVIVNNWIVFWLKVDKNEYENIKQKLQNFKK